MNRPGEYDDLTPDWQQVEEMAAAATRRHPLGNDRFLFAKLKFQQQ
jgi:hypothetical protein